MTVKVFLVLWCCTVVQYSFAQEKPATADRRTSVDLTIYNQNLSLIREERTINIGKGVSTVVIPDIPATIDGTSLHFLSLTEPSAVRVLEQNYQYDLVNQGKLLEKYIGKEVEFVRLNEESKKEYTVKGRLLSTGYQVQPQFGVASPNYSFVGGMVAEINGKIEINPAGRLILPSLPEGLILKPQLEWLVSNTRPGEHKTEISYLAGALSWNANYVALLDKNDASLDLTGWVTLTNNSGTSFNNAGLKLVAGDVNMVREQFNRAAKGRSDVMASKASATLTMHSAMGEWRNDAIQSGVRAAIYGTLAVAVGCVALTAFTRTSVLAIVLLVPLLLGVVAVLHLAATHPERRPSARQFLWSGLLGVLILLGAVLLFLGVDARYGIEAALLLVVLPGYFVYKALVARDVLFVATTVLLIGAAVVSFLPPINLGPRNIVAYVAFFEVARALMRRADDAARRYFALRREHSR